MLAIQARHSKRRGMWQVRVKIRVRVEIRVRVSIRVRVRCKVRVRLRTRVTIAHLLPLAHEARQEVGLKAPPQRIRELAAAVDAEGDRQRRPQARHERLPLGLRHDVLRADAGS